MKPTIRNIILLALMLAASGLAVAMRPTHRIADDGPKLDLAKVIPGEFGDWQEEKQMAAQIINPQQQESLAKLYTQTLSRTYVNHSGERVMLSIAYGADQSDAKALHYPEVCYPAQGFRLDEMKIGEVETQFGNIRVKRLLTALGNRIEPITYWTTVGNKVVVGGKETKLEQLRYAFHGQVPDGLIFRASSITNDTASGYEIQADFVRQLVQSITPANRLKLAGLDTKTGW